MTLLVAMIVFSLLLNAAVVLAGYANEWTGGSLILCAVAVVCLAVSTA